MSTHYDNDMLDIGKTYGVIYADPPWSWSAYSHKGEGRSAKNHYSVMSLEDIKALPVSKIAARDCVLFIWVSNPMLPEGLEVVNSWGFKFKTLAFTWVKTNKNGSYFTGLGYHTRCLDLRSKIFIFDTKTRRVESTTIGTLGYRTLRDIRIWTHNGWKMVFDYVENASKASTIRTRIGDFMCSPDHKWAIKRLRHKKHKGIRNAYHSIEFSETSTIGELRQGSEHKRNGLNLLLSTLPMEKPEPLSHYGGIELTDEIGWLIGLCCAEGTLCTLEGRETNQVRFSIHQNEVWIHEKVKKIIADLALKNERYYNRDVTVLSHNPRGNNGRAIYFSSKLVKDFLTSFITGGRQKTRRLALDLMFQCPASFRHQILMGYLAGDGVKGAPGYMGYLRACSCNPDLVSDFISLSESIGVLTVRTKPYYGACSNGKRYWSYGFALPSPRNKSLTMGDTNVIPVRIDGVDNCDVLIDTCDISVEGGEFITGGIITHNSNSELCLIGTRGHPKRLSKGVRQLVVSQRREHSRKPDEMYDRIEVLYGGPYIELFARQEKEGWDSWGNETDKFTQATLI